MDFQLPKRYGLNKPTFKVMAGQHFAKFDSSLKPLKNLNSFIDLSKPIKELNYIEHRKVRQIMQHLKFQSQSRKYINHQDEQIAVISQQLEMELENLAREDCPTPQVDLLKLQFPLQLQTKFVRESAATLETHYNLHRIKEKIHYRNITLTESNLLNQITQINFQTTRNSDSKEFYHNFNTSRPRGKKEPQLSLDEKYQILKEYLKERGIQMGRKESVPNEGYLQFYHEATNRLIKQTKEQQLLKFRKSFTLKTTPDNQDQSPLKKMSIVKITTVPTTVGTTPALNGITPNNLTMLHSSLIKFSVGNNGSPIMLSHRHRTEREKSPEKPYSEKWQDFHNKAEALQSYYLQEGKEYLQTLDDLENTIEKPYLRHFNQIIKVEQEEQGNLEEQQKQNKIMRNRKQNLSKKLRMQKIFKSELQ